MTDYGQGAEPLEPGDHQTPEPDEIVTEDALVAEDTAEASVAEASWPTSPVEREWLRWLD